MMKCQVAFKACIATHDGGKRIGMGRLAEMIRQSACRATAVATFLPLGLAALLGTPVAFGAAGSTPGTFAVSASGASTYSIPIFAPRGPNGLQPSISLVYNSQTGDGIMGVGWTLAGLSTIYRCNLTYAQDPSAAPVTLSSGDGYCLDGQRLRLTSASSTYGQAGSTYQTEIANFATVTAYGTQGNGPAYFIVQQSNGVKYYYGNGGGSQVLANGTTAWKWLLNEVVDTAGNTMTVSYDSVTGDAVPDTISWTPTQYQSSTYNYTMKFGYPNPNVPQSSIYKYVAGSQVANTHLLSTITIQYTGSTVKEYFLSYQAPSPTGRYQLYQVQECADSAQSNCLQPTKIGYQNGAAGVTTSPSNVTLPNNAGWFIPHYDFNGDGYKDLLFQVAGTWYVAFGSATGYKPPVNTGITTPTYLAGRGQLLVGDLLGVGQDGLLANNSGEWFYYTWVSTGFGSTDTGISYNTAAYAFALADTNGDGLPDLISADASAVYIQLNTSSTNPSRYFAMPTTAFSIQPVDGYTVNNATFKTPDTQPGGPLRRFDFNGDGRDDVYLNIDYYDAIDRIHTHKKYFLLGNGNTFTATQNTFQPGTFVNWNNDACTDWLDGTTVYISACNGNPATTIPLSYTPLTAMDWDGDGRTDLVYQSGGNLYVQLSTGNSVGSTINTGISYNSWSTYWGSDVDGDGLDDLVVLTGASGSSVNTFSTYAHNGGGQPPDLATSFADGNGNTASPTYVSLVQHNYTQSPLSGVGGYYPYNAPTYVTSQVVFSDPSSTSGATYNQQFWYYSGLTNIQGRGPAGFGEIRTLDSRTGLYDYKYYETAFPYSGMMYEEALSTSANNSAPYLKQSSGTVGVINLSTTAGQQRYFPYFSNRTTKRWELGGSENGDLITTDYTTYTFDNYGNATTITRTVTDNDPGSPYNGATWTTTTTNTFDVDGGNQSTDISNSCLNLLKQQQVAYTDSLSTSDAVTRTKSFTPDPAHCRYSQIVTEPNSATYKVTEVPGYDQFGNVNSDSLTGVAMGAASPATRTTYTNWTSSTVSTGQFPMTVTDASGAQFQWNYDFRYGLPSSSTDPNSITTTWAYTDGFGRLNKESRPDGTSTSVAYVDCASSGGCLIGPHALVIQKQILNSDATVQRSATTYLDPLGRPLVSTASMLESNTLSRNEVRYDSLGRVSQTASPCIWSSLTVACSYWTTNYYDALSRLTKTQRPISASNPTVQSTGYTYAGRKTTITDPYSNSKTLISDVNGWMRQTKDAYGYAVTLAYDAAGGRIKTTDSAGNTLWSGQLAYGIAPFLTGSTDIDLGTWSYTVDALGEVTGWQDAKGQSFSATFDALSRALTRTEPDLFTQWTWGATPSSHDVGKLQSVCTGQGASPTNCTSNPGYAEAESYDSVGRLSGRTITIPTVGSSTYSWAYNSTTGLLDTLTYPVSTSSFALELKYGYSNGILQSVTDIADSPNQTLWQANSDNAAGQIVQETLGNGVVTNYTYDAVTYWLSSITAGVNGGAGAQNQSFLYDEMGNVTQRQENNLGLTENVYYDNDYRFSYSSLNGTQNLSVTYDSTGMGNIASRSDVAGGAPWTYDSARKHAVTQAGSASYQYGYDANGNVSSRQGSTIGWSSYNYPTLVSAGSGSTAESISLAYGPFRQRWQQTYISSAGTETTRYIGGLLEKTTLVCGVTAWRHYVYVGGRAIAIVTRKSSGYNGMSYLLQDHQSSVAAITNSSGSTVVSESFTPFGARRDANTWSGSASATELATSGATTRQGYTFQTQLGMWMGLNHMNGRVQDAITGRFLSADPHIPDPANSQSYNRYTYTYNNPLSSVDPTGFDSKNAQCKDGCGAPMTLWDFASFGTETNADVAGAQTYHVFYPETSSVSKSGLTLDAAQDLALDGIGNPPSIPGAIFGTASSASDNQSGNASSGNDSTAGSSPAAAQGSNRVVAGDQTASAPGELQQGNQLPEVTVTGTRPTESPPVAQFQDLPPGIEVIIEGSRVPRGAPKLTPEQPMPPTPRAPVQSPVNPSTTPPPGQPGWLWWQMLQFFFRGWFGGGHSVVPPVPTAPTDPAPTAPWCPREDLCA